MASNREAAQAMLGAASVAMAVVAEQDPEVAATVGAVNAIGFALLDVADAIREQTAEIHAQTAAMTGEGILVHEGGLER